MIDKNRIEIEAEAFFEFPTADKMYVTRTSMLIFAGVIAEMVRDESGQQMGEALTNANKRIEQLERENAELQTLLKTSIEQHEIVGKLHQQALEAALKPGEPACYQYQSRDGNWNSFINEKHHADTALDGTWPIRALFTAAPPAQTPQEKS